MATVQYLWYCRGTTFMYLQYSRPPSFITFANVWKASYTISASIFVDVPYWPPCSTYKFISCVVPGPSQWFYHFRKEIVITWTHIGWVRWVFQNTIILHDNARCHTAAAVTELLHRWQWEIMGHASYPSDKSPCNFIRTLRQSERTTARGPLYSTGDELIRAIGRSIRNNNKYGRADGIRRIPNIWQKVINKGGGDYRAIPWKLGHRA